MPQAFDHLKGEDASFEMVTSNTIQPVRLCYRQNIITHSVAMIFVSTHCKGIQYRNAVGRGEQALKLFKEELKYQEVHLFKDVDKKQIIEKLAFLRTRAAEFEASKRAGQKLSIGIACIGHILVPEQFDQH